MAGGLQLVARLVGFMQLFGIGKRGATYGLTRPHGVEFGGIGTQGADVAQKLAPGQLRVGHDAKVLCVGQDAAQRASLGLYKARQANPLCWSSQVCDWAYVDTVRLNPDTPQNKQLKLSEEQPDSPPLSG